MATETKPELESGSQGEKLPVSLLLQASKLVGWVGVSTGALTLICTVFGYVVEHAWLDHLGIPRIAYDSGSTAYVISGLNFLTSLIPLAVVGALEFILDYWWMVLVAAALGTAAWRLRLRRELRLLSATILYAVWLGAILIRFQRDAGRSDPNALAIFTFGTIVGLLYCYREAYLAAQNPGKATFLAQASRLPIAALVFSSFFALPYLKGIHGTERTLPKIQFIGKDRAYFCELVGRPDDPQCGEWELIELGKDRALLRWPPDRRIVIVPASAISTFQLQNNEGEKR
jgi:hypothetical protein